MRILLAEDEKALSKAIVKIFEKNNYSADAVYDGEYALAYIEMGNYDVAVLDIMMPKMDGITVLKKIRAEGNQIPVLMLTAKSEIEDRVLGLDSGANDYLPKPFDTRELLARIRSITRSKTGADTKLTVGNVTLDRATFGLSSPAGGFSFDRSRFSSIMRSASSLTVDEYKKYAEAESVSDFYYTLTAYFNGSDSFSPVSSRESQ